MKVARPLFARRAYVRIWSVLICAVIAAFVFAWEQTPGRFAPIASAHAEAADAGVVNDNFDPVTGYRIRRYQAAVPQSPPAGTRVWIPEIDQLVAKEHAALVDVSPITGAGYDPKTGAWRSRKLHESLPGAIWLPEVGRGTINDVVARFFADSLSHITHGNPDTPIIIFCNADCWMSWNAMKRADQLGYTRLYWFPEGIDGWQDWDRKLVPVTPTPINIKILKKKAAE